MATTEDDSNDLVRVADAEAVRESGRELVRAEGRHVAVFYHEGEFHAVDNRCPYLA